MLNVNDTDCRQKKDGFNGQKAIVIPRTIVESCLSAGGLPGLALTDIGYYPRARHHFRHRDNGCDQSILIYCSDGLGWVETDKGRFMAEKDQFIVIPAGAPHAYGSSELRPWSIYWVHFAGSGAGQLDALLTVENTRMCQSVAFSEERIKLFERMFCVLETGYSADKIGYVNMCLVHFLSSFCFPDIFLLPQRKEFKDLIEIVVDYMRQNLHKPLQLHELASQVHISVSYFSSLFKRKTGYSPLDYFNHIKIQKACQYLLFTDMHIKEIACKLGVDDPFYFSRLFNNVMGMPPAEYRSRKSRTAEQNASFPH